MTNANLTIANLTTINEALKNNAEITFKNVGLEILPNDFKYIGFYTYFKFYDVFAERTDTEIEYDLDFISERNLDIFLRLLEKNRCSCCNHVIKRGCFFSDKNNDIIFVGFDCTGNILKYRNEVQGIKKQTLLERRKFERAKQIDAIFNANEGLEEALKVNDRTIANIAQSLKKYATISDKQIAFVFKLAEKRKEFEVTAKKAIEGKFEGEFKVLSCKWYKDAFTELGYKVLLESVEGWKAYGKYANKLDIGITIKAAATFKPAETDEFFAYFKRLRIK
jgi:hypothetical protein